MSTLVGFGLPVLAEPIERVALRTERPPVFPLASLSAALVGEAVALPDYSGMLPDPTRLDTLLEVCDAPPTDAVPSDPFFFFRNLWILERKRLDLDVLE